MPKIGRAFFPLFALLNHECAANAEFKIEESTDNEFILSVKSRRDISEGDEITVPLLSTVLPTHKRRRRLEAELYLDCRCRRCSDPTELGTRVGALTCEICPRGCLLPRRRPMDPLCEWLCDRYI